ncbi:MAG: hypothetical protein KDA33_16860, partial [Phycisphaerales bacterium]|nr:hypothetical protein [Phycisphaerales bacterium]
ARAAENRVFVCVGDDRGISMVVDPAGVIRHSVDSASAPIVIRPSEADSKQFTPTTPIWSQRRVETYRWVVDKSRDAGGP